MSLMYLARMSRPDILMCTSYLATKSQNPTVKDYDNVCQILRYIRGTVHTGMIFNLSSRKDPPKINIFTDASHLLHEDGKGHTGIVITLGEAVICTRSVKQKVQARSSTEAEIIAAEEGSTYVPFLNKLQAEITNLARARNDQPVTLYQDNLSAIHLMTGGGQFNRTKHMLSRISYLRDQVKAGSIVPEHLGTADMVADMLTKPLPRQALERHKHTMNLMSGNTHEQLKVAVVL